jgi:hypothetical protein
VLASLERRETLTAELCRPPERLLRFVATTLAQGSPGRETGEDYARLRGACPDSYSEVPMAGIFYLYVNDTEAAGGVSGIDGALPATWSLSHWAAKRWPRCSAERERQGYPKVMPCSKCK